MLRPDVSHSAVDRLVWTVARIWFISDGWRYTTVGLLFIIQETRFIVQLSPKIEETKLTRLSRDKLSYTLRSQSLLFLSYVHSGFLQLAKKYHRRLGSCHLSLGTRFRQKPQNLASIRCFLRWENLRFQPFLPLTYDWWSKWLWWKTGLPGQTGLENKYREIFVLVLGVICTLLTKVKNNVYLPFTAETGVVILELLWLIIGTM